MQAAQHLHATPLSGGAGLKCSPDSSQSPSPIAGGFNTGKSAGSGGGGGAILANLRARHFGTLASGQTGAGLVLGANPILGRNPLLQDTFGGQNKHCLTQTVGAKLAAMQQQQQQNNYSQANSYYSTTMSYANESLQQQQQPPTADLLGTGYQCQQQQQPAPIYHIATGNAQSQTTRLIWHNGFATAASGPDGAYTLEAGAYMPLSSSAGAGQPRSEGGGSVYQTIY